VIPLLSTERACLLAGDAADLTLPPNSVDAIVCDPPAGVSFMGKSWDDDKGGRDEWIRWLAATLAPAFHALKPGGYALVWALPRTSHWTALALEYASFEIRDRVSHLFGTGFPKSLALDKAIDDHFGAERVAVSANPNHRAVSGVGYEGVYAGGNTGAAVITAPATAEAKEWEGWGTALKPACEDWWLVRKPLEGTYAENVLKWGVGGLNIDSCRITTDEPLTRKLGKTTVSDSGWVSSNRSEIAGKDGGRWPAHLVLDEEAAAALDATQPKSQSRKGKPRKGKQGDGWGMSHTGAEYEDAGGPSRFFYVTKPSKAEKNTGCDNLPVKSGGEATDRVDGSKGLQNPRAGAGRGGGSRNFHPTVKSVDLMRWLCRLIAPPGGVILDPFCGSGSTGVAALAEGFSFIGVEQSPEYAEIAKARLEHALKGVNDNE
jgi:site-specific DNA-methyltransferase (adenine-specific)